MTDKQQETLNQIRLARTKERPELKEEITTKEEGKHVLVYQGKLPVVRIGPGGGIYLPDSKSFASSTPQVDPTPLEAATFPEKYTKEAIAARRAEKQKAEKNKQPVQEPKAAEPVIEKPVVKEMEKPKQKEKAKSKKHAGGR